MAIDLDRVRELVAEVAEAAGCELVEVELRGSGRQRVLRVFIDKEAGVSHGDCEHVSRELGTILDVEDLVPFSYTLEVSSPGLDRKLTRPEDFIRFRGRTIKVRMRSPIEGRKVFRGGLEGFADGKIRLSDEDRLIEIPLDRVQEARLEVDWDRELHATRSR